MVPVPRTPRCLAHHIWHAGCIDCCDQRTAEQAAARKRLEAERRRVEAGGL
jgi:hypothetical protein